MDEIESQRVLVTILPPATLLPPTNSRASSLSGELKIQTHLPWGSNSPTPVVTKGLYTKATANKTIFHQTPGDYRYNYEVIIEQKKYGLSQTVYEYRWTCREDENSPPTELWRSNPRYSVTTSETSSQPSTDQDWTGIFDCVIFGIPKPCQQGH